MERTPNHCQKCCWGSSISICSCLAIFSHLKRMAEKCISKSYIPNKPALSAQLRSCCMKSATIYDCSNVSQHLIKYRLKDMTLKLRLHYPGRSILNRQDWNNLDSLVEWEENLKKLSYGEHRWDQECIVEKVKGYTIRVLEMLR